MIHPAEEVSLILSGRWMPGDALNEQSQSTEQAFWLLTALPGLWFIAEVLTMLTNDKRRALHDVIAGTVVIRTNVLGGNAGASAEPNRGVGE